MEDRAVYLREVVEQAPRLIGLIDRNPGSRTYGCFDRQYWHYNTTDFPCAEYQESVLTLAYLFLLPHGTNPYCGEPCLLEWINAGIGFWRAIQNRNGAFAEWYPYENSMSVTPFSTYAVSETLLLMGDRIRERRRTIASLKKAGNWLLRHKDLRVANHYSGSTIALYNLYLLTGEEAYRQGAERIVSELHRLQDEEGWFVEYKGADVGYTSVTLYYLAQYYKKTHDPNAKDIIARALDFLFFFMHPDGTFGGEYGSRNTEYLIPNGFEIMAPHLPKAALIGRRVRESLHHKGHVAPFAFDDRYLCYLGYMYIQAYADAPEDEAEGETAFPENFVREFPNAGLRVIDNPSFFCVQSLKKGGLFKIDFKVNGRSFLDGGIVIVDRKGRGHYSFYFDQDGKADVDGSSLRVERKMARIPGHVLTPAGNVLQRLFATTLGRIEWVESLVKNLLRDILVTNVKISSFHHSREVCLSEKDCTVIDRMDGIRDIRELQVGARGSYVYGPSTRFFQPAGLGSVPLALRRSDLERHDHKRILRIVRVFDVEGNLLSSEISSE
ncbi:MAG: terpene cyclase/mutase family protein [Deltaproteobacteria bacterium]|nr:terpene cyclase/mutase family protein [Deltaproteobacteria bacterium]